MFRLSIDEYTLELVDTSLIGVGLYSVPEAARLIHAPTAQLHRWMFGYLRKSKDGKPNDAKPVTGGHLAFDDFRALSFFDLLEARLIKELRDMRISLQSIRIAADNARTLYGNAANPFVFRRIRTDGQSIFAEAARDSGDEELLDLVRRQQVFKSIIERTLIRDVELGTEGIAARWYPLQGTKVVVVDPARSFGKPIINGSGVRTWTLYSAYLAEDKNESKVARTYRVSPSAVRQAVRFETSLAHGNF